jgi:hypothetical protein
LGRFGDGRWDDVSFDIGEGVRGEWFGEVVDEEIVVELGEDVKVFFCMSASVRE